LLSLLQLLLEGLCWLYRLGYGFGLTKYYSPTLQLANVKLTYAKDPSPTIQSSSAASRFLSIISQIVSNGLFLIQLIDWWNKNHSSKQDSTHLPVPITTRIRSATSSKRQCLLCRQPCNIPTVILGSGYVYCHSCISDYVKRYHRCPTSHQPVTNEHLIKIS
jgi:peroxin-12